MDNESPEYQTAVFLLGAGMAMLGASMAKEAAKKLGPAKLGKALRGIGNYNNVLTTPTTEDESADSRS